MTPYYAVLSGDIVKSQQLEKSHYANMLTILQEELSHLSKHYGAHFEVFRGDSFQLKLEQLQNCIEVALLIRLKLKQHGFDCRISIGIGDVTYTGQSINTSTGTAFTLSGHQLDKMQARHLMLTTTSNQFNNQYCLLIEFSDILLTKLTAKQAAALYLFISAPNLSHQQIASTLKSSRVNVTKLLGQANYTTQIAFCHQLTQAIKDEFYGR